MSYQQQFHRWLHSDALSPEEKAQLQAIADDPKEVEDRFFGLLEFGTAGLRGVMGLGLRRMNVHVIRHATQAFAQVILAEGPAAAAQGVAICYDCRVHSQEFARAAAGVMPVRLFEAMRPTPELSFAVREYGCVAGLNVTASHNPPEYNGYKVYWSDGAQLPPQHAAAIAAQMEALDVFDDVRTMDYEQARAQGLITLLGRETDDKFLSHVLDQINDRQAVAQVTDAFRMVYTPFHGTGYQQIPYVLEQLGIRYLHCVPEQMVIDGTFPTVKSPNPETPESFALAQKLAKEVDAQLILGSDPDADRVAIQVKDRKGDYVQISGNQTGVLLLDYLIAFMALGTAELFARPFKNRMVGVAFGTFMAGVLRFLCSFLSGVLVWGNLNEGLSAWTYSLVYNASYMLPETLLTVVAAVLLIKVAPQIFDRQYTKA